MTEFGERVLVALADQGFGLIITTDEVRIISRDGRRTHRVPSEYFERNGRSHMEMLLVTVIGLEYLEGFVIPMGDQDS